MESRNKAIYAKVYQLIISDNDIDPKEFKYLNDLANALRLNKNNVLEIIEDPSRFLLVPPPAEPERMKILYYLLFAMQMDGRAEESEQKAIYLAGSKLGFPQPMVKEMIGVLKNHLTTVVPDGVLVEIIRKYMN